jgi:hypothetical protein
MTFPAAQKIPDPVKRQKFPRLPVIVLFFAPSHDIDLSYGVFSLCLIVSYFFDRQQRTRDLHDGDSIRKQQLSSDS